LGYRQFFLVTNGVLLTKKIAEKIIPVLGQADMIRISVFENNPSRYARSHGCSSSQWHILIRNLEYVARLRKKARNKFTLSATVYPFPHNKGFLYDTVRMLRELKFDLVTVTAPLILSMNPRHKWPRNLRAEHRKELGRIPELETETFMANVNLRPFEILEKEFKHPGCQGIDFFTHVAADAGVYPCFKYWLQKKYCYGNLKDSSFSQIWKAKRRYDIRARVLAQGPDVGRCCNCAQCRINETLWQISHPTRFANFI
jgi:sulfatase maturation enzyme AslB (radical SAM superfamily)